MSEASCKEGDRRRLGGRPVIPRQGGRVDLKQCSALELPAKLGLPLANDFRAALGMSEQDAESAVPELLRRFVEIGVDAIEGGFDEQPLPTGRAYGYRRQLRLAEAPDHLVAELATAVQRDADALAPEPGFDIANPFGEIGYVGEEVASDMGRDDDPRGSLGAGRARELDGLVFAPGAIVDAGEEVEVDFRARRHMARFLQIAGISVNKR